MIHPARRITLAFGLLALWLQLLAPALALGAQRHDAPSRFAICHAAPSDERGGTPAPHIPSCDHCVLCHAVAAGLLPDGRPPFTLFDYPVSSPLRWAALAVSALGVETRRAAQPRGPPILA